MHKILFVCHGNICRSPMAEYIMKYLTKNRDDFLIESKATSFEEVGNPMYYLAKEVLDKHNIPYGIHNARRITRDDYDKFDFIIVMDEENLYNVRRVMSTDNENKIKKLLYFINSDKDVDDPWYTRDFDRCYQEIYEGCKALLDYVDGK